MIQKICLDQDGVLADFVGAACRAHARSSPFEDPANRGAWDIAKLWGISEEDFWAPLQGENFWVNLEKTPEADMIVAAAQKMVGVANVCILTTPDQSAHCIPGKRAWMAKNFPYLAKQMIFTGVKRFLAAPNTLLIDDGEHNVDPFRGAGGNAILVPRMWNRSFALAKDARSMVQSDLELFNHG